MLKYVIKVFRKSTGEEIGVYEVLSSDFEMAVMHKGMTPLEVIEQTNKMTFAPNLHDDWTTQTKIVFA